MVFGCKIYKRKIKNLKEQIENINHRYDLLQGENEKLKTVGIHTIEQLMRAIEQHRYKISDAPMKLVVSEEVYNMLYLIPVVRQTMCFRSTLSSFMGVEIVVDDKITGWYLEWEFYVKLVYINGQLKKDTMINIIQWNDKLVVDVINLELGMLYFIMIVGIKLNGGKGQDE